MTGLWIWVVPFVVVFGTIVLFHELGHFLVAKRLGVKVHEFAIGIGRPLLRRRVGDTVYSLRLLPLGGFVKLAGMDPALQPQDEVAPDDHRNFHNKPLWARMLTIAAGPAMNFVLAILLLIVFHAAIRFPLEVGQVLPASPAHAAGLRAGDRLLAVGGEPVETFEEFTRHLQGRGAGRPVTLTLERGGERREVTVVPTLDARTGRVLVGITVAYGTFSGKERLPLGAAVRAAVQDVGRWTGALVGWLGRIVTGRAPPAEVRDSVAGPIGIVVTVGESARQGLGFLLLLAALLNVNLALLNLLPIPVLDGGWLVFLLLEGVRGRPLNPEQRGLAQFLGLTLLLALVLFATYLDLQRLFSN